MEFKLAYYKRELSDEEILTDIKETSEKFNQDYVSISFYKKHGKYSQTAIQNHFGTWRNALKLAGLRTERKPSELKRISDDEYFIDLRRVAEIIGQNTVPYDEYIKHGKYSAEHIFCRFNKWNNALELAGLCSTGYSKDKIMQQDCFDEIERIWRLLGRQPTSTDITSKNISKYSIDTYKRRHIFNEYIAGKSFDTIANELNQAGGIQPLLAFNFTAQIGNFLLHPFIGLGIRSRENTLFVAVGVQESLGLLPGLGALCAQIINFTHNNFLLKV